ncbi:MAG: GNAT family N-acetyltransferase, partial [Oligosphaeraceae bacterium]
VVRPERPEEHFAVEALVREAFWNVYRPGCLEHYVLHCLRRSPAFLPSLSLVLYHRGELAGQIAFLGNTLISRGGEEIPILTLGPLAILPAHQRKGLGRILLDRGVALARETGAAGIFLEGNPAFYGGSGFVVASTLGIRYMEEPAQDPVPYFLACPLDKERLAGVREPYRVPAEYFVSEEEAEVFDRQFPPREKLRLPGQLF